jgi:hypothetical protein
MARDEIPRPAQDQAIHRPLSPACPSDPPFPGRAACRAGSSR